MPNDSAERTPVQSAKRCGGFQRESPTGGRAYGIPRKIFISPSIPSTAPASVETVRFIRSSPPENYCPACDSLRRKALLLDDGQGFSRFAVDDLVQCRRRTVGHVDADA